MQIKARILVVDDNCDLCENIKDVLEGRNYFAECAVNGKEATELARNNKYDVVLIDIRLPDISGNEVVEKITEISPSTDFIYMTGHASIKSAVEAVKQERVVSYEIKPLDLNHLLTVINQVIERKRAEEELGRIFELSVDMICVCDIKKGYFKKVNPAFEKTLGYSEEELLGRPFYDFMHPDDIGPTTNKIEEILATGKEVDGFENRYRCKDGSYKRLMWSAKVNPEKGITYAIAHDITERKKMEEALLQSEKLKSIGTITAGISHEFNNLLAIISGNVQLLEESLKDDEDLMATLRTIKRATNDGAEISSKMLKFTQTANGTTGLVPFDINELINQAIDFTSPRWKNMAQAKGINYHMDTESMKRVPYILSNPTELREVFVNIIHNALDAMPDDGRVTFRTWSVEDTVFISISDTGKGMPAEVMKNIFDPFFTTRTPVGTGLGLSTAYGIVVRHRGNIEVESVVERGSTFTLQFPAAVKADSPKESTETVQETEINSLRILVVDDEEAICNILDNFLSKKGHLVRTVDSGREALILTKAADYDLVLCDIAMPDVFGYDVIKALNELENRPKIGIITGWEEEIKTDEENMKVDFILKKPFELSELTNHINKLFI